MYFIFPPPNYCFCTTCGTGNPEIASFHLNAACFFTKKHETVRNTVNITWSELNQPRQDLGREHSVLLSVTHMLCVSQVLLQWQMLCKRWELFFVKPGVKVDEQY